MKTIKATFIGEDGSLGYVHGKEYELDFKQRHTLDIIIHDKSGEAQPCEYANINKFFENWSNIKTN